MVRRESGAHLGVFTILAHPTGCTIAHSGPISAVTNGSIIAGLKAAWINALIAAIPAKEAFVAGAHRTGLANSH